jgi:hypothetical protein
MIKKHPVLAVLLSFIVGLAVGVGGPRLIRREADRLIFPEHRSEIARVTSPDGTVDAVMELTECGAPCSSGYAVTIVPKGNAALRDPVQQVFIADDMVNAQIRWQEAHLLVISYDKAFIDDFRNVAYPFGRAGDVESWRYEVEIRLAPSSSGFSYLANENGNLAPASRPAVK